MEFIITNDRQDIGYQALACAIEKKLKEKGFCRIAVKDDKRKLPANAQQHVWYQQISDETGEDIQTVTNRCKRDYGLSVVLNGDHGKQIGWTLEKIGFWQMQDAQQLNVMNLIQVTSLMTSAEHSKFRDNMQHGWREKGVNLQYLS